MKMRVVFIGEIDHCKGVFVLQSFEFDMCCVDLCAHCTAERVLVEKWIIVAADVSATTGQQPDRSLFKWLRPK